ncbi:MAG: UPF0179 family protein [Methanobacteriaceae archaeon]|jgi:hypothetical protein|nr:UPF0179 family protein [Methanobacteriaceae archaeon]
MITLIGKDLAKEGNSFIFYGPADECEKCRFKSSCVDSLEKNRKYIIKSVKENGQKCPIHDENEVLPVVIERANIAVLSDSKNIFEGSTFRYEPLVCDENCEYKPYCFPEGLIPGDKCVIMENEGKHKGICKKGYDLHKLELAFVI